MKLIFLTSLIFIVSIGFAQTPLGRVQIKNGTLVTDKETLLRGAYVSIDTPWDSMPPREYITAIKGLGLNCIHLYAEHPEYQLTGDNVAEVDSLVKWTKEDSLYIMITMSGWSSEYGNYDYVTSFWSFYATRYKDKSHVIFEICNEPFMAEYPYTTLYDSLTIAMERAAYDTIRNCAPETHIIFMSYPFTRKNYNFMQDIRNLGEGIDWNNASIGIHGYGVSSEDCRIFIESVKDSGYAIVVTESPTLRFYDSSPDLYVNLAFLRIFEKETVSYINFLTPRHLIDKPFLYKSKIESSEIRWTSDFGTWPESLTDIAYPSPYTTLMTGFYDEAADINPYEGLTLWYLPHNAYIAFYNLDFESGADTLQLACSSEFSNSKIRIHIDSLDGELIGTCLVPITERDNVKNYSIPIKKVEGVHKIYMVIESTISRFNSIKFNRTGLTSVLPEPKISHQSIVIYPNPTSNNIYIGYASEFHNKIIYSIIDLRGKLIQQGNIIDNSIDVSGVSRGVYILKLNINGETNNSKILIK
jgi:hypothetical protein